MNIVFQIDGGLGKCVAATAVCKAIKAQYPKDNLFVICGYPQVFLCIPGIKAYGFNELRYFFEQNIEGQDVKIMAHNPYVETNFVKLKGHLIQVWCEMFGLKYNGEQPELFVNNREQTFFVNQLFGQFQKPILLLHTNGGGADQPVKYSWMRDMPLATAQQVVNHFANDYQILHIRRKDQLALENVTPVDADFRALAVLIKISSKRLFIDSFAQHTAAALGKPSVVCWIGNSPAQFGYEMHTNIIANPPTVMPDLRSSVYSRYNIMGQPTEFPYNHEGEIFNVEEIIAALKGERDEQPQIVGQMQDTQQEKKKKKEKVEVAEVN